MTSSDWLDLAREHRADLRYLVRSYHPASHDTPGPALPITAPGPERAEQHARQQIALETKEDPVKTFDRAIATGQVDILYSVLSQTWHGVPESTDVYRLIGFRTLCDLLDDPPEEES